NWIKEARIKAKIMQFYGEKTMSTNQWKTLDSLSSLIHSPYYKNSVNLVYFSIYDKTGPLEKGAEYHRKIVLQGGLFDGNANRKYAEYYHYDSLVKERNSLIDTNLLNFFSRWDNKTILFDSNGLMITKSSDSILIDQLDSICKQYGKWPGIKERGNIGFHKGNSFSPYILVKILNEKQAYYFYNLIVKECEIGNERWNIARIISSQLIGVSKYNEQFYKIRNLKLDDQEIDDYEDLDALYFQGVRFFARRNTWKENKINIYPTELWGGSDYNAHLTKFMDYLIAGGVPYESIQIKKEIIPMDENEEIATDYYFVFEIDKK
ncbi:MAG: hypothetical protein ABF240_09685, partial [Flavobacteriales bacterium]